MASDSAVLILVGTSFHHWGTRTGKSHDFAERALFPHSNVGTSRPADIVERSAHAGACDLISVCQQTDPVPLKESDAGRNRKPMEVTEQLRHMGEFG